MNIFIAQLNTNTKVSTLQKAFEAFGTVADVRIITDEFTGKSKGFGFVEMPDDKEAQAAIEAMNAQTLDGETILVKQSRPREEPGNNNDKVVDR